MPDWPAWPFPPDNPYPAYAEARAQAPVRRCPDVGAVLVLSHEHALAVLRGPEWSVDPRNSRRLDQLLYRPVAELLSRSLPTSDPPTHTRLRAAVSHCFTPRTMAGLQERIAAIAGTALEPLRAGAPLEVMGELAYPLALAVMGELLDVGEEGARLLRSLTPVMAGILELDASRDALDDAYEAAMALMLFLVPIVAERRRHPGDDLISALGEAAGGADALETDEIITTSLLLLAAGHETTANLIGNGVLALLEHPDQLAWLGGHPERARRAVDELLRYESPVQLVRRAATRDLDLGGVGVRAGEEALVCVGAANRDPVRYSKPDILDLSRRHVHHLAFGGGLHHCLGATLARLEGEEVFRRLAEGSLLANVERVTAVRDESRTFRRLRSLTLAGAA